MASVTVQRSPTPSTSSSPCVSESGSGEDDRRSQPRSISESFSTVKGAALFSPRGNGSSPTSASLFSQSRSKHAGDIQQHSQTMFTLLRPEDNIKSAVRLESANTQSTRYMVVVSTIGRQDTEESVVLGMDFSPVDSSCSVGMVLPLWSDTLIHSDGDGGFSVSTDNKVHVFKPVSVQAMWSASQSLHKACEVARCHNYFPGSLFLTWVSYYQSRVSSDQARINEWNAMQDVQSHRADSPVLFSDVPTERELTERQIKTSLREIMMQKDLENVTSKEIRTESEMHMTCNLREFKEFIDKEMIVISGQMDSPTEIFDHVFLGSEWNASNLEESQKSGVQYISNVTREIDNFFPGVFEYHNIRVYDEEATDSLAYWNDTYKFISRAKKSGSKCSVHCKMGVSRSAATVIAYAMKEYGWDLKNALEYVKERRTVTKPNPSFMRQSEEYQGISLASKQRHNKLWRSHSDSDSSEHHEPSSKSLAQPNSSGRSDPHNQAGSMQGTSVRDSSESSGTSPSTGKATYSTSQPDTGIQSSQRGSSAFDDTASLSGDAKAQSSDGSSRADKTTSRKLSHPHPDSTAGSVLSPNLSNGSCDSEDQPSLPPLSQPRAATVVPELDRTDISTVAQSVSVGQPHPPPAVHLLPPSPAPSSRNGAAKPQVSSCTRPVSVPEPMIEPNAQQPGSLGLSAPVDDQQTSCSDSPSSNDISHPNAIPQDNVSSFGHSADHINFFSAREKFKEMSHDGKTQTGAVQQSAPLKSCGKDLPSAQEDLNRGGQEEENRKEVHAPVRAAGVKPTETLTQSEPQSSHGQEETRLKQEMENLDTVPQKEAKSVKEESKHKEDEEAAPPRLYSDWTRGSVRRVTQQSEQRMRRESETSLASSSAGSASCSQRRPNSFHSMTASVPQDASVCSQVYVVRTAEEQEGGDGVFRPAVRRSALGISGNIETSTKGHKLQPADTRSHSTSSPFQHSVQSPFASVNFLCSEGVTELESSADRDCFSEGLHADATLRETWETLCELGAFSQQVRSVGVCETGSASQGLASAPKQGSSSQNRFREMEARIRQAGSTPPSSMKRSASLAKSGCSELLASDSSESEHSCSSTAKPSSQAPLQAANDESKKQRVHSSPLSSSKHSQAWNITSKKLSTNEEGLPPSNSSPPKEKLPDSDQDSLRSPGPTLSTNRQQYGKTHPSRQLQRRTVSTSYDPM